VYLHAFNCTVTYFGADSCWRKEPCITWGSRSSTGRINFWGLTGPLKSIGNLEVSAAVTVRCMQQKEWPSAAGASIEAPKAPRRVGFGEGVSPFPIWRALGRGHAPSPENFSILSLKMATFSAFWALAHVARGPWPLPSPLHPPVGRGPVPTRKIAPGRSCGQGFS